MAAANAPAPAGGPISGLYDFVRNHLTIANQIIVASGTLVAVLDFMSPKLPMAPRIVYSATAAVLTLMVLASIAPGIVERAIAALGLARRAEVAEPLWRRPAWQFAVAILMGVTVLGWASIAKASQGGLIASAVPGARELQARLLAIEASLADTNAVVHETSAGVRDANAKLDRVAQSVDPDNAADKCADVGCAVEEGADAPYLRKLLAKGAPMPSDLPNQTMLMTRAMESSRSDRLETMDLLLAHGIDPNMPMDIMRAESASELSDGARALADDASRTARLAEFPARFMPADAPGTKAWNALGVCLIGSSRFLAPLELAAMRGDAELYAHLAAKGAKLPARPLVCAARAGGALIQISDGRASAVPAPARPQASARRWQAGASQ